MKTNDYLLLSGTAAYSYLFYNQNAGINFLLFNTVFITLLLIRSPQLIKNRQWLWAVSLCLASATGIFLTSSVLAIIANCFSLLILSGLAFNVKTSSIFSFLFGSFSVASSFVYTVIHLVQRLDKKRDDETESRKSYKGLAVIIVAFICLLFLLMYRNANPLFAENTKWLNFDFLSFSWMLFTAGGFFLVYGLFYHQTVPVIERWDNTLSTYNKDATEDKNKRYETEVFSGILLFIVLNLMLVILNIGDISTIWLNAALPKGMNHTDFVHSGVGMIILSIVIATSLLMYLYRKNIQVKHAAILKLMVYLWILQNLIMLFSTSVRNQMYIHDFSFTYKRIGVYVWIVLAAIGLMLTFLKIFKNRSNWYLVKSNFALWFTVLSLSSLLNWDLLITRYNLANKPIHEVDYYYLFSLSDSNIPELINVTKHKHFNIFQSHLRNYTNHYSDSYYSQPYLELLQEKIYNYVKNHKQGWQSTDVVDQRVTKTLFNK